MARTVINVLPLCWCYACHSLGVSQSVTTCTLGLSGGGAWAQLPSPSELRQQFQETDRNGDGRIDREEFHRRSVDLFYFLYKGRKGYLMIGTSRVCPPRISRRPTGRATASSPWRSSSTAASETSRRPTPMVMVS
jgi:EF hand